MGWITLPCEYDEDERQWARHHEIPRMQCIAALQNTFLTYKCSLDIESLPNKHIRLTSIACNIGYTINKDVKTLQKMMESGMTIARLNLELNNGNLEYHSKIIENIREAAKNYSTKLGVPYPVAIAFNTTGSEVKTGYLEGGEQAEVELVMGNLVKLTTDPAYICKCSSQVIFVDYENIFEAIAIGRTIFIDDGLIKLVVQSISGAFMICKIEIGGILGNKKGLNLPGTEVDLPSLTETDKIHLKYGIKENLDMLFCAFIRNAQAVLDIRKELGEKGKHIKLISKIEDLQGLGNLQEIIDVSDGVVIARGDLYLEVGIPKLFIAQKYIAAMCNKVGCPVVISRELIDSMIIKKQPTRAEISDVANAILDGIDVILLSRETIKGNHVNSLVKFVSQICKEAEATVWRTTLSQMFNDWSLDKADLANTVSMTAVDASIKCRAAAIFVITDTGFLAHCIAKYRPRCPIVAITRNSQVARQCHLYRAIIPFQYTGSLKSNTHTDIDAQVVAAIKFGKARKFIKPNDPIVIIIGTIKNGKEFKNTLRMQYVEEELKMFDNVLHIT